MQAVMYGAGNIGRGFIGPLFANGGYSVTFVDVAPDVVLQLNEQKNYPVRIIKNDGYEDRDVGPVCAVDGNDGEAVARAVATADIMATAVGVRILGLIAKNIASGLSLRFQKTNKPLNIIICENLLNADKVLECYIKQHLTPAEQALFDKRVGLVEASIGRMVPVQTREMQHGNPLRVCVEEYGFLPVDKAAFKGDIPSIPDMIPCSPFSYYLKRKLFMHNMGHATCAYLGMLIDKTYIYEAVDHEDIHYIVLQAMLENAMALSNEYDAPFQPLYEHILSLLYRFTNQALLDTCARVGADPARKLGPQDRLVGAALNCLQQGVSPAFTYLGTAAALRQYIAENEKPQNEQQALQVLLNVCELPIDHEIIRGVMPLYDLMRQSSTLAGLRGFVETARAATLGDVI
ncbi:MAG: mannitol dehydrogenase [Clostridiales bacterium]|jgi:mannitol-1-phosphate 5-dehydrogenase|nr:mannitol dehydrogenase [Clostridiales bacterium]